MKPKRRNVTRTTPEAKLVTAFLDELHRQQFEYIELAVQHSGLREARQELSRIFKKAVR